MYLSHYSIGNSHSALATKADRLCYIKAVRSGYKQYNIKIGVLDNNLQEPIHKCESQQLCSYL